MGVDTEGGVVGPMGLWQREEGDIKLGDALGKLPLPRVPLPALSLALAQSKIVRVVAKNVIGSFQPGSTNVALAKLVASSSVLGNKRGVAKPGCRELSV